MKQVFFLLKILLAAFFLLAFLIYIDIEILVNSFKNRNLVAASFFVIILTSGGLCIQSFRLKTLINSDNNHTSFPITFKAIALSTGLNLIFPARLSEFLKPIYLHDKIGLSISRGISITFLERSSDVIVFGVLSLVAISLNIETFQWYFFIIICVFLFLTISQFPRIKEPLCRIVDRVFRTSKVSRILNDLFVEFNKLILEKKFWISLIYGIIIWGASAVVTIIFIMILGLGNKSIEIGIVLFVITTLAFMIPALPGGVGLFEAAGILVLKRYGYSIEEGLILTTVFHFSTIMPGFAVALTIVIFEKIGMKKLMLKTREQLTGGRE